MSENVIGFVIVYYVIALVILFILLAGIDKYDSLIVKYGMYRGATLEVIIRFFIAIFWLPYALFYWIRGLVRGE